MFNTLAYSLATDSWGFRSSSISLLKRAAITVLGLLLLTSGTQAATSSAAAYPGAGPELLVDGTVDISGSWWAAAGTPNWVEIDLGQSLLIGRITAAPFAGAPGKTYFYNESWKVQYRDDQGNLRNFASVVKTQGAGTLAGPGIAITDGDPGVTGSRTNFKFYEFTFSPVSTRYIRYTVTAGDRDGDSNGSELEVGQVFLAGSPVRLVGAASDPEDGALNSRISWRSNLDGALGSGRTLTVSNLKVGTHTITARVEDNDGAVRTTTTSITVIDALPETEVLTVTRAGTGSGTVNSSPGGINCGSDCSQAYDKGTVVTLSATPASGSEFVGWSGTADCSDGKVTMNGTRNCTATFNQIAAAKEQLNITRAGTGSGTVNSSPGGINCGSDCSQAYDKGTVVTLSATPASGSEFVGWSGTADCSDGKVTMNGTRNCTATFNQIAAAKEQLNITRAGTGSGTVNSSPGGINCGSDCSQAYDKGTVVTLSATPASGSEFVGWSGTADCSDGKVTMNGTRNCTATFNTQSVGRFQLTVAKSGLGAGKVISSPAGINCGSDCKHTYNGNTVVTLTANPANGSAFAGWSGTSDCRDGRVTMKKVRNCVATFDDIRMMFGDGFESGGTGKWTISKP